MNEIEKMRSDLERLQQRIADRQQHYITDNDPVTARMVGRKVELERALVVIEPMRKKVERLQADVQAKELVKETIVAQRNRAYEVNDAHLKRIAGLEQERDQLKATLQRFMELDQNDRDLPLELWAIQHDVSPADISLARHDAEVVERLKTEMMAYVAKLNMQPGVEFAVDFMDDKIDQLRQQAKKVQS